MPDIQAQQITRDSAAGRRWTRVWIPVGAALFVVGLGVSATVVPQLRMLHLLQALIYVAIMILASRNNVWALGAGVTIAVVWNGPNLFVTHLIQAGAGAFWNFLLTGQLRRIDTMMVTFASIGHFVLIFACLAALFDQKMVNRKWWKAAAGGVMVLAYLALIVAIARPP